MDRRLAPQPHMLSPSLASSPQATSQVADEAPLLLKIDEVCVKARLLALVKFASYIATLTLRLCLPIPTTTLPLELSLGEARVPSPRLPTNRTNWCSSCRLDLQLTTPFVTF